MKLDLKNDEKYILACSFGPDSMALFDMLLKQNYSFIVCFVNYHTRKESEIEEKSIKEYCLKYNIKLYVKNDVYFNSNKDGNFEAWARDIRYKFFRHISRIENTYATLIAHHQDDLLETFVMQKERHMLIPFYGISKETTLYDMKIVRPLLEYKKKDLLLYCASNNVPYSIDYTNLEDVHTRNKIRHNYVEKLSDEERNTLLKEIENINKKRNLEINEAKSYLSNNYVDLNAFNKIEDENVKLFILYFLIQRETSLYNISKSRLYEILKLIKSNKPNLEMVLNSDFKLVKSYDALKVNKVNTDDINYEVKLLEPGVLTTRYFKLDFLKDTSNRNITIDDYPLTIRSYKPGDYVEIKGIKRSVRRLFIDWKMPLNIRKYWPVFLDKNGRIIYVPRYQNDFKSNEDTNLEIFTNII